MRLDSRCNVAGKVLVDGCGGTAGFGPCDCLGKQHSGTPCGPANDSDGLTMVLNRHIPAGADVGDDGGEVTGGFRFRDVDGCHIFYDSAIPVYSAAEMIRATTS